MVEFEMQELFELTLVAIIGVFLFFLITSQTEFIAKTLAGICDNPDLARLFCPTEIIDDESIIAKASTDALAYGINTVFDSRQGTSHQEFSALRNTSKLHEVVVDCNFPGPAIGAPGTLSKEDSGCTIRNYWLPQKVSGAEEWIAGYGDPKFINYYIKFPEGEEKSWSGFQTWLKNVQTIVLYAIPVNRVLKFGKNKAIGKLNEIGGDLQVGVKDKLADVATRLKLKSEETEFIIFTRDLDKVTRRKLLADKFASRVDFKKAGDIKPILKIAGVSTTASLAGAYIDSITEKYNPQKNGLALKSPYQDPGTSTIRNRYGDPVLLNKESFAAKLLGRERIPFYLASPCSADLKIRISTVGCGEYQKTSRDDIICTVKSVDEDDLLKKPQCGNVETSVFDPTVGAIVGTSPHDCITSAIEVTVEKKTPKELGYDDNFCFTTPSKLTIPIFIGAIVADVFVTAFSAGILTEVAVGLTGATLFVLAERAEDWP